MNAPTRTTDIVQSKTVLCYDTETTGLTPAFNVPLQFGCIIFDEQLHPKSKINVRGRFPSYVLPSPAALVVTGQRISDIAASPTSHYHMMRFIAGVIEDNAPAVLTTYNGLRYDDEILRYSF